MKVKNDHRSKFSNLGSWKEEASVDPLLAGSAGNHGNCSCHRQNISNTLCAMLHTSTMIP